MRSHRQGELIYFTFPLFDRFCELTHAVSTRLGGLSTGVYRSLNIGFHVGDEKSNVLGNRKILCKTLGLNLDSVVAGEQVHGTHMEMVQADDRGKGAYSLKGSLPHTDALITDVPGICLLIMVADCPGVLLYDPKHKAIALAHAGWRGGVKNIIQKVVRNMSQSFHTDSQDLLVGISPSIGPCCYRIGEDTLEKLASSFPQCWEDFVISKPEGSFHLDLWGLNKHQLLEMGVKQKNIEIARLCSVCRTDLFYSYRKQRGRTGRCGVIMSMQ